MNFAETDIIMQPSQKIVNAHRLALSWMEATRNSPQDLAT